jgi:hypothetical protein
VIIVQLDNYLNAGGYGIFPSAVLLDLPEDCVCCQPPSIVPHSVFIF